MDKLQLNIFVVLHRRLVQKHAFTEILGNVSNCKERKHWCFVLTANLFDMSFVLVGTFFFFNKNVMILKV